MGPIIATPIPAGRVGTHSMEKCRYPGEPRPGLEATFQRHWVKLEGHEGSPRAHPVQPAAYGPHGCPVTTALSLPQDSLWQTLCNPLPP